MHAVNMRKEASHHGIMNSRVCSIHATPASRLGFPESVGHSQFQAPRGTPEDSNRRPSPGICSGRGTPTGVRSREKILPARSFITSTLWRPRERPEASKEVSKGTNTTAVLLAAVSNLHALPCRPSHWVALLLTTVDPTKNPSFNRQSPRDQPRGMFT